MLLAVMSTAETASGESGLELTELGSGMKYGTGSGAPPPPPPPDTTLEELTTWVIVIVAVCLLIFIVIGLVWVADGDGQPRVVKKRQGWLVWNGNWYKMDKRKVVVLQEEKMAAKPTETRQGAPVISVLKPGEELRPLVRTKEPR